MVDYPAIGEIDDPSQVRVALIQNKQIVHAPIGDVGLLTTAGAALAYQPLDADLTSWAAITRASGFDTFVATPSSANLAALVTDESGSDKLLFGTPWVTYTPTFTGFGTVSNVGVRSRRIGDTLYIRCRFTSGTPTAVEARVTLGFNGTNGGITSDATADRLGGLAIRGNQAATIMHYAVLTEASVGYVTFGAQTSTTNAYTKANGNALTLNGDNFSFQAEITISGW